jgi:hypothetical protein
MMRMMMMHSAAVTSSSSSAAAKRQRLLVDTSNNNNNNSVKDNWPLFNHQKSTTGSELDLMSSPNSGTQSMFDLATGYFPGSRNMPFHHSQQQHQQRAGFNSMLNQSPSKQLQQADLLPFLLNNSKYLILLNSNDNQYCIAHPSFFIIIVIG